MDDNINIVRLKGKFIIPYLPELANLRIKIFRDYPYLYEGNLEYEKKYLHTYSECDESVVVLAMDKDTIVGLSTGIPMQFGDAAWSSPFIKNNLPINDIFYLGESVLLPEYRGKGIYKHFFHERESAARLFGSRIATFAAVERPENHPKCPKDYVPLDAIWSRFGYVKRPELCAHYEWQDIDESKLTRKPLIFWLKAL